MLALGPQAAGAVKLASMFTDHKPSHGEYTVAYQAAGFKNPMGEAQTFDFKRKKSRFVKINVTKSGESAAGVNGLSRLQLAEMEVYDTRTGPVVKK